MIFRKASGGVVLIAVLPQKIPPSPWPMRTIAPAARRMA